MHTEVDPIMPTLFTQDGLADSPTVTLRFEEREISAPAGTTLAAALLMNGVGHFRTTPVNAKPRAAYCMMGVCFECLVEVDGIPGRQSCLTPVQEGMHVRRQQGASALDLTSEGDHGR